MVAEAEVGVEVEPVSVSTTVKFGFEYGTSSKTSREEKLSEKRYSKSVTSTANYKFYDLHWQYSTTREPTKEFLSALDKINGSYDEQSVWSHFVYYFGTHFFKKV